MRILTYIATRLLIIYAIGNMAAGKEPVEIPLGPSGHPAPMSVSKTYPFFVSAYDKREVRLVERKLKQEAQTREFILGGGGDFAVERISLKEDKQQAKDRQLDAAETAKLTSRILSALERHHGLKILTTLKMVADDKDLAWISKRDDAKDLIATVLVLDALRSMHQLPAEQAGGGQPATRPLSDSEGGESNRVISLEYLDAHQKDFLDREVVVAAFLCPHSEGPSITANPKIPFKYSMGLVVAESSVIVSKDLTRHRWWYQDEEEGFPVILSGVFRIQDWKSPIPMDERIFRNPCIEVKRAEEVAIDNSAWRAGRNMREQAGSGQPAIRSQTKPEDGDKPQPR